MTKKKKKQKKIFTNNKKNFDKIRFFSKFVGLQYFSVQFVYPYYKYLSKNKMAVRENKNRFPRRSPQSNNNNLLLLMINVVVSRGDRLLSILYKL